MSEVISSPHNRLIKLAAALKQKKYRDEEGLFVAEGIRLAEEAIHSGWPLEACLYTPAAAEGTRVQALLAAAAAAGCRMLAVTEPVFAKAADTQQPQGIMVLVKKRILPLAELLSASGTPLVAVLDEVQDPGNAGTLIRTAVAAGCSGIVLTKGCTDVFSGKTVRGSMGALFQIPVAVDVAAEEAASAFKERGITLLAASLEGSVPYYSSNLRGPAAVVFGNEGNGVSEALLKAADTRIHIPLLGKVESLNVAAAAAVILYEAVRQRQ